MQFGQSPSSFRQVEGALLGRRVFLRVALPASITGLMAACNGLSPAGLTTSGVGATAAPAATTPVPKAGTVQLPTSIPRVVSPDLPGSPDGLVDPGYTTFPSNPIKAVPDAVGHGEEVSLMTWTNGAVPNPVDQNAMWQAINHELGVSLTCTFVPFADYITSTMATTMAGGSLPDLFGVISSNIAFPLVPEFFESECTDLTPYLSGDAVKDYPNLAAIPTRAWKTTIFNDKIFGIPQPLRYYFYWFWVHQELLDQAGLAQPKDGGELKQLLQAFTRPQENLWGIATEDGMGPQVAHGLGYGSFPGLFRAPNYWSVDANGNFTATQETDEYKAAVAYVRDLFAAGVFHPNSTSYNTLTARTDFIARKFAFRFDGLDTNGWLVGPSLDSPNNIRMVAPFGHDGGQATYWYGPPSFGMTVLKKGLPDDRVKLLLRILNYVAAPFGSQEYLLLTYGVQNVDYTLDDKGNPRMTDTGKNDLMPWTNLVRPAQVLFNPLSAQFPTDLQADERALAAIGVDDPTVGLFSRTYATKGATATSTLGDALNDIVTGRRPLSDLDGAVNDWLSAAGTQAKAEFREAYLASRA